MRNKCLLFKPPSLWSCVVAAWDEVDTLGPNGHITCRVVCRPGAPISESSASRGKGALKDCFVLPRGYATKGPRLSPPTLLLQRPTGRIPIFPTPKPLATTSSFYFYEFDFFFLDFTHKWYHAIFVFLWLISLNIVPSRSICVVTNDRISFFLMAE